MNHRPLGRTGVKVSPLCLGAMMFGGWGNPDHDEGVRIIHRALDAGINFIDTADVYSRGESEEIVGKALAGRRDDVVLATKVHGTMGDDPNQFGNSRRWIMREVEDTLRRLKTDWIDLYQIHRPEPDTDIDETLGALTDLVRQGKVRYIGSSTFPASQIVEAQWVARERGRERFVCEQPPYSLLARGIEADVLPTCQRHGMGVIPWSPLGRRLAERHAGARAPTRRSPRARSGCPPATTSPTPATSASSTPPTRSASSPTRPGMTLIQMALAFVINHPAVTAAIIGPRTMEQLESQLGADEIVLDADAARPHRRDRPARDEPQPGRRRLAEPGARSPRRAAASGSRARSSAARAAAFSFVTKFGPVDTVCPATGRGRSGSAGSASRSACSPAGRPAGRPRTACARP